MLGEKRPSGGSCTIWPRSAVAINPVNWRTDAAAATLVTEPSPLLPLDRQKKDTLRVTLDTASNLLVVNGYSGTDYLISLIGKEGNYHSREIRSGLVSRSLTAAERCLDSMASPTVGV